MQGDISAVIQMAWEDRTSFETIKNRFGLSEADVVRFMRNELTLGSTVVWRMLSIGPHDSTSRAYKYGYELSRYQNC
jgi:uncharacterized protein (TIGR03643 family)